MTDFPEFPKIPRLTREVMITEKLDGTNALISIDEEGNIRAGSRSRWITPEDDNYGFAKWVEKHKPILLELGPGNHYGEWWGQGIQRRYGMEQKVFSLFAAHRWNTFNKPSVCQVVPILYNGIFNETAINNALDSLRERGSWAAAWYGLHKQPAEGIMIYHTAAQMYFKKTLEGDESPKGKPNAN